MSKKRAFLKYTKSGDLIPGSLIITNVNGYPRDGIYKEVDLTLCCSPKPAFRLLFSRYAGLIGLNPTPTDVTSWNTLLASGDGHSNFTSVEVIGNEVFLYGGVNVRIGTQALSNGKAGVKTLLYAIDEAGVVTSISDGVFGDDSSLYKVSFPNVTSVDYYCFTACKTLTEVYIPLLTSVSEGCFSDCTLLYKFDFPLVTTVGLGAFTNCSGIDGINMPLVTTIAASGFSQTDATVFNFPLCISVGDYGFGCLNSKTIDLVNLPLCTSLGSTTGDNSVFFNTVVGITNVPVVLETCDLGDPDGDLQYLTGTAYGVINYV